VGIDPISDFYYGKLPRRHRLGFIKRTRIGISGEEDGVDVPLGFFLSLKGGRINLIKFYPVTDGRKRFLSGERKILQQDYDYTGVTRGPFRVSCSPSARRR